MVDDENGPAKCSSYTKILKTNHHSALTFDIAGKMGRVARYEELQLPLKVASVEVHIPRSESCDGRGMKKLSIP